MPPLDATPPNFMEKPFIKPESFLPQVSRCMVVSPLSLSSFIYDYTQPRLLSYRESDQRCLTMKARQCRGTEDTSKKYRVKEVRGGEAIRGVGEDRGARSIKRFNPSNSSLLITHCCTRCVCIVLRYFGAARDLPGVRELFQKQRKLCIM